MYTSTFYPFFLSAYVYLVNNRKDIESGITAGYAWVKREREREKEIIYILSHKGSRDDFLIPFFSLFFKL